MEDGDFFRDSEGKWQFAGPVPTADAQDLTQPHFAIPGSLHDVLERRINKISSTARLFASCVSVIGQEAPFSLLQEMSEQDEWKVVEVLRELQQGKILEQRETRHVYFVHEQMRHLAYELLSPAVKSTLHRKAAECLEASPTKYSELLHDIGYHWEQAGEREKAKEGYSLTAEQTAAGNTHERAARLYQQALSLTPKEHEEKSQPCDTTQKRLEHSLQIFRTIGHRQGEGFALGYLAHHLHQQGESEKPLLYLQQAIPIMSETHTTLFEGVFRIYQHKIQRRLGISQVTLQNHLTLAQECLQTLGQTPYMILLYCERGHLQLMQQQPANDCLLRALSYARQSQIAANSPNEWSLAITRLQQAIMASQKNQTLWNGEHPHHWPKGLKQPN